MFRWAIGAKDADAVAEFGGSLGRMKPEISLTAARTVFLSDYRNVLPQVGVNTTIIFQNLWLITSREGSGLLPTVAILKTQGHFPHLTVPSLLLSVVKKALGINT